VTFLRVGTLWCGGLALLVPAPWAWMYAALAAVGVVLWVTAPRGAMTEQEVRREDPLL
jgi:hypothetical protein